MTADVLRIVVLALTGLVVGQTILISALTWRALPRNGVGMTRWHIIVISLGLDLYAVAAAVEHVLRVHRAPSWRISIGLVAGVATNAALYLIWRITRVRYAQHKARTLL